MPSTSPLPFPPQPRLDDLLLSDDDDEPPSGHATSSTLAHAQARAAPDRSAPEDIEMGTIPAGHRRRRSSILNPIVAPTRARARSLSQAIPLQDEVKEVEEGDAAAASAGTEGTGSGGAASGGTTTDFSEWSGDDEDLRDDEETGLTRKERDRRRRAKRRNTLLDQRIAPEKMSMDEEGGPDETVTRAVLINAGLIALWYIFSLSISLVSPVPLFPCPCPDITLLRAAMLVANQRMTSITNGCSTTTASTSDSRYSRRRRT